MVVKSAFTILSPKRLLQKEREKKIKSPKKAKPNQTKSRPAQNNTQLQPLIQYHHEPPTRTSPHKTHIPPNPPSSPSLPPPHSPSGPSLPSFLQTKTRKQGKTNPQPGPPFPQENKTPEKQPIKAKAGKKKERKGEKKRNRKPTTQSHTPEPDPTDKWAVFS